MLQFASEIEPVITVNNISSDGNDAQKIRSIVDRIAQCSVMPIRSASSAGY